MSRSRRHGALDPTASARRGGPWRPLWRALTGALAVATLLLALAWAVFSAAVRSPPLTTRDATPSAAEAMLTAVSVSAPVERGRRGASWTPLAPGSELREDELIRTGPGGGALLAAGGRARITVSERTELSVRELGPDLHHYGLSRGHVLVDYEGDETRSVRVEGSGAVAEARGAKFRVAADGLVFAVATQTGRVDLSAAGASMAVEAGRQAASRGGPPSAPRAVPRKVLLKVAAAGRTASPVARCVDTTGRADPEALVTVDGVPAPVDEGGRFRIRVDRPGGAPVEVVATLPDGRTTSRWVPCRREEEGRVRDIEVRWRREP